MQGWTIYSHGVGRGVMRILGTSLVASNARVIAGGSGLIAQSAAVRVSITRLLDVIRSPVHGWRSDRGQGPRRWQRETDMSLWLSASRTSRLTHITRIMSRAGDVFGCRDRIPREQTRTDVVGKFLRGTRPG